MVYFGFDFLAEIVEKFYLSKELTERMSEATVIVNPRDTKYIFGKTVIVNKLGIDPGLLQKLSEHNTIIYRVKEETMYGEYHPYLDKYIPEIVWSGIILPSISGYSELTDWYIYSDNFVSLPKITKPPLQIKDSEGNLDYLGFILYQTGSINFPKGSIFSDLDVVKTGKVFT